MNDELPDPLPTLDPALRSLIDLAESDDVTMAPMPADVDARIHARLGTSVSAAGVASKLTVALVIGAVAVGTTIVALVPRPEMNNAHADFSTAPIPHGRARPTATPPAEPAAEEAPHEDNPSAASDEAPARAPPAAKPSESKLVDQARAALRKGDLDVASARIAALHRWYPHGALAEERDALEALDDIKRHRDANAAISKFEERHPNSVHRAMLDAAVKNLR